MTSWEILGTSGLLIWTEPIIDPGVGRQRAMDAAGENYDTGEIALDG